MNEFKTFEREYFVAKKKCHLQMFNRYSVLLTSNVTFAPCTRNTLSFELKFDHRVGYSKLCHFQLRVG